jgi:hypothetical protein
MLRKIFGLVERKWHKASGNCIMKKFTDQFVRPNTLLCEASSNICF